MSLYAVLYPSVPAGRKTRGNVNIRTEWEILLEELVIRAL
jgi:hypothetical protein